MPAKAEARFLDSSTPPHIITLVLMAGVGAMNMAAFLPALPAMTQDFATRYDVMQLSVSLYLGMTAILQIFIGPVSDRYGRRPVMLWSLVIFVLAVLGCMIAPNVETFLLFRMISGMVAAGLVLSRAIVRDMVPQDEAASMIGYVTMGMALVPMVAPMIGGVLHELFGWHSIFWFLAAAGTLVFFLILFDQGETAPGGARSFADQFADYPELLTSRRFWGYVAAAAFGSGAFFAFLGGAPLVATEVYGLSAFWAGVGFGAPPVGYAIGNGISGRYSVKLGINRMIELGAGITTLGLAAGTALSLFGMSSALVFFLSCTFIGLGNGMIIPNASAGMLSVRPHLAGTASGLGSAFMIGGGAFLSSLAGVVLDFGGGSVPLLLLMTTSAALALVSIYYVKWREQRIEPS